MSSIGESSEWVRAHIFALEEQAVNELYRLYQQSYALLVRQLSDIWAQYVPGEKWTASDAAFAARAELLMRQITQEAARLSALSSDATLAHSVRAFQAGYHGSAYTLAQGLKVGLEISLPTLPTVAIRAQLLTPYLGNTFLARFQDVRDEFVRKIRRSLIESQIQGEGIVAAQKRIRNALGIDMGRRTAAARDANAAYFGRTEMIARTELLRASNLGAQAIYEVNRDVVGASQIVVTNDERTCEICAPLDGQEVAIGDPIELPPFHPRCRCTVVPVIRAADIQSVIVHPRQSYSEWAAANSVSRADDGGAFALRGVAPPQSPSPEAVVAAPHLFSGD